MQVAFAHEGDKAPLLILRANGELLMTNGPPRNGGGGPNSDFVPAVDEPLSAAPGLLSSPIISASMRRLAGQRRKGHVTAHAGRSLCQSAGLAKRASVL